MIIYHITQPEIWNHPKPDGLFYGDSLSQLGFIHCCTKNQISGVLKNWFAGKKDLLILEIEVEKIDVKVIFENLEGNSELFPHIYGAVNLEAIQSVNEIDPEEY